MDMLKRDIAPLTKVAWEEIEERAEQVLKSRLSARKVVKVNGPKGWDYTTISEGRLEVIEKDQDGVKTGKFKIKPLVEARVSFKLDRWEMDNIVRGAKDIELENLEEAAKKIADFEEKAVYSGYKDGEIVGLEQASAHDAISFGEDASSMMEAISKGLLILRNHFEDGPFTLVVGEEAWNRLNREAQGYPLLRRIESLLGGKVVYAATVKGAFLLPFDSDDLELTIGQDFAIGYEAHDSKEVSLFITETFSFRVLDENLIVPFTV